jgi:hypothetical protein
MRKPTLQSSGRHIVLIAWHTIVLVVLLINHRFFCDKTSIHQQLLLLNTELIIPTVEAYSVQRLNERGFTSKTSNNDCLSYDSRRNLFRHFCSDINYNSNPQNMQEQTPVQTELNLSNPINSTLKSTILTPKEMLAQAALLRAEANQLSLEVEERRRHGTSIMLNATIPLLSPIEYSDMADSLWTITYRCASSPMISNEPSDYRNNITTTFYQGTVDLRFRSDGYTDLVAQQVSHSSPSLVFTEAWGWDVETSTQDNMDYLLFAIDAYVTDADPNTIQRYYWQAREDRDRNTNLIAFQDGNVAVKRDVRKSSNSIWGAMFPPGIMAQFCYIGDFILKPKRAEKMT